MIFPKDADASKGVAYADGKLVPIAEATVSVLDWGFSRSDVTYDVVHVWKGAFFRLDDHLERFERSCAALRLDPGLNRAEILRVLAACVRACGLRDAYVEMLCTRGVPTPGSRDPRQSQNRFMAYAIPFVWVLDHERQEAGARLHIADIPRIDSASVDPTVKNFHWGDLTRGLFQALDHGADTTVLVDSSGVITEGPGFNVFVVKDATVTTPALGVLEGITRASVRELCEEARIPFALGKLVPQDLMRADEVFLSSTAGGIMPVSYINNRVLGAGRPGPLSRQLRHRYWERHNEGWHATPIDYEDTH